jgi:hypothetical protein
MERYGVIRAALAPPEDDVVSGDSSGFEWWREDKLTLAAAPHSTAQSQRVRPM